MVFRKLLLFFLFAYIPMLFAQDQKVYFEDALSQHLKKYNIKSDLAIKNKMPHEVDALFDSLIKIHLRNTYISDLKLKKIFGGTLHIEQIDLPFLLVTKNSAILQTKEEIKTINALANEYNGLASIIILYWNSRDVAKKIARNYNKNITVVYADERDNRFNHALSAFKHAFGAPAGFYINQNKQISSIDRKFFMKNDNTLTQDTFTTKAHQGFAGLLLGKTDMAEQNDLETTYR